MTIYLAPCPFCGSHYVRIQKDGGLCDFYYYARCNNCGARTNSEYTEEEAAANWNKRSGYGYR